MTPVTLPPGRERLAMRPTPSGSATLTMTIGTVDVAAFAARLAGVVETNNTSAFQASNSRASAGKTSNRPSA